ncbi:MAG: invasion associated locus B family protein [Pseudomonadota bacterium]
MLRMIRSTAYTCGFMVVCLAAASIAYAQESTNRVDARTDWSIFVEDQPTKECWIVSKPTKEVNTRGGRVVTVRRSDILLWVTYRPANGIKGQVSFTGGYPFDPDKPVRITIGTQTFNLFVDGEYAWPASDSDDSKIRDALKRGSAAVVEAQSRRGTTTKDTFSLNGFTAALAEAEKRCS